MLNRSDAVPQLDLNRSAGRGPWMVDMQGFFEFSFWMAEELLDLEARMLPSHKLPSPPQAHRH